MTQPGDEIAVLRSLVLGLFRAQAPLYSPRWVDELTSLGDFEGRDYAIEFFNAPADGQLPLRRALRNTIERAEKLLGRPIVLLFHTPEATARHYHHVVKSRIDRAVFTSELHVLAHGDLSRPFATELQPVVAVALRRAA
jgi:hypothetical protein